MQPKKNPKKLKTSVAFFILGVGIIIGGFLVLKSKTSQSTTPPKDTSITSEQTNQDVDKDGLLGWEEEIYQTDPQNPDTDGDGYFDGEEIASGYDPLKPGPNDKLSDKSLDPRPAPGVLSLDSNFTQTLLKNIVAGMMTGSINPVVVEEGDADLDAPSQAILEEFLDKSLANSSQLFFPDIKDKELKISNDNSVQAIKDYLTSYSNIVLKYLDIPEFEKTEMEDVLNALQTNNFYQIEKRIEVYKNAYEELKNLSVPPDAIEIHKLELQVLLISINTFEAVKNINNDPLKAVLAIQNHPITIDLANEAAEKIGELINKRIAK